MSESDIEFLPRSAGSRETTVRAVELPLVWPEPEAAAFGITGSTYGPAVASLSGAALEEVFTSIVKEASGEKPPAVMRAMLGRGIAGEALRGDTYRRSGRPDSIRVSRRFASLRSR